MRVGGRGWLAAAFVASAAMQAGMLLWPASALPVSGLVLPVASGWAAVNLLRAARRDTGRPATVWALGGAAAALWTVALVWFATHQLLHGRPAPHPSPADVPNLLAVVLTVAALLLLVRPPRTVLGRGLMLLDGLLLTTALLGVARLVALPEVPKRPVDAYGDFAIVYPLASVLMLAVALLFIAGDARGTGRALATFCTGLAVSCASGFVAIATSGFSATAQGAGGNAALLLGLLITGAATHRPPPPAQLVAWDPATPLGRMLPYVPVPVIFCCALYARLTTGAFDPLLAGAGCLLVGMVLCRQFLMLRLNSQLTLALTEQRREFAHQARHDPLTGLANRTLLAERLAAAVATAAAGTGPAGCEPALLLVDLDGFKAVNDSLGHAAGDELLVAVAGRLRGCAGPGDTVARLGGDEFAVLLAAVRGPADVAAVAHDVLAQLMVPVAVADGDIPVRATIGGSIADPNDRSDADRLLRDADIALYAAKADGKGRFRLADAGLRASTREQMKLDRELRGAVDRGELEVFYQPIVELHTGLMVGAEALLRWRHPERGLLAPGLFLPAAEAAGMLPDIDRWVLLVACRQAREWRRQAPEFAVSVNISAGHLTGSTLVHDVTSTLAATGLPADALVLELTETALVTDTATAAAVLAEVVALGVSVALDDFGTGYSSLTYLRTLPIHTIKIDGSFVQGLGDGAANDAVVRAILDLAETLGLRQVAEGVETEEQAARLRSLRCRLAQGYHFSRPVPAIELGRLLAASAAPARVPGVARVPV
ncbi:MAG TPA: EAL domain-containing protein [Pilimelia sp.]|nr:EAL domain-containing protein [Pilimelia sp.]